MHYGVFIARVLDRQLNVAALAVQRPSRLLSSAARAVEDGRAGAITVYRRHNKPALSPVGDSLDHMTHTRPAD
jgi:predicted TIM-barrel fold metal-dependent hydrolase